MKRSSWARVWIVFVSAGPAVALAAEPVSSSEIDNGYTGGKLLTLPAPADPAATIVDQCVADSPYGGSGAGFPDVFRLMLPAPRTVVIEVVGSDPDAIDYGILAASPAIELPGSPRSLAYLPPEAGSAAGLDAGKPGLWIAFGDEAAGGLCLVDATDFRVVRTVPIPDAAARKVMLADTPHGPADGPADLLVATQSAGGNRLLVLDPATGETLHVAPLPPGEVLAAAVAHLPLKSAAVGGDPAHPWVLVATHTDAGPALHLATTAERSVDGGTLAPPPGRVTSLAFADTPLSGANPEAPDIFIAYADDAGSQLIRVYDSQSNNYIGTEYPPRTPAGGLVGLAVVPTDHPLGIGDPGHAAIIYAINDR